MVVELGVHLEAFFLVLLELHYLGVLVGKHPVTPFVLLLLGLGKHLHVRVHHIVVPIYVHRRAVVYYLLVVRVRGVHWQVILVSIIVVVRRLGFLMLAIELKVHKVVSGIPPPLAAPKLLVMAGGVLTGHGQLLVELPLLELLQVQLHQVVDEVTHANFVFF